jgi:transposase
VAQLCGLKEELGKKGSSGILHNMNSRATFLENKSHRIRFVYTPKHCSWLNQIEIWFGILSRRLLKRGNFSSTEELKNRILKFIEFFNETLAKPFRWTYIGKPLLI